MITSLKTRLFGISCDCDDIMKRYLDIERRCKVLQEENSLLQQTSRDLEDENSHLQESMTQAGQVFKERSIAMGDMWIEERNYLDKYQRRLQIDVERKNRSKRKEAAQRHREERAHDREVYETELNRLKEDLRDYRESDHFLCRIMKEIRDPPGKENGSDKTLPGTHEKKKDPEVVHLESRVKDVIGMFQTQQMIAQRVKGQLETERHNNTELREKLHIATTNYEDVINAYRRDLKTKKRVGVTADGSPVGGKDVAHICYWGDQHRTNAYRNGTLQKRLQMPSPTTAAFRSIWS
jgi:hypothetical protein